MSSPTDYIFMKPLDKCVVIIINILSVSRISIEFMMRNTILAPRWFKLSSTTFLPSPTQTCSHKILVIHPFWHVDGLLLSPSATPSSFLCWNCMTYFLSCFRWILCVSEVRPFPDDHVNTIPKHVCGTPIINKNIGSAMLTVLDQYPNTVVWVNLINSLTLCLNGLILGALSRSVFPWESYTLILGYIHLSFPLVWLS